MRIYVGNLAQDTTRAEIRGAFGEFGQIDRLGLAKDGPNGKRRNFALVEMAKDADATRAITALNGSMLRDRPLKVREIRPKASRS